MRGPLTLYSALGAKVGGPSLRELFKAFPGVVYRSLRLWGGPFPPPFSPGFSPFDTFLPSEGKHFLTEDTKLDRSRRKGWPPLVRKEPFALVPLLSQRSWDMAFAPFSTGLVERALPVRRIRAKASLWVTRRHWVPSKGRRQSKRCGPAEPSLWLKSLGEALPTPGRKGVSLWPHPLALT